MKVAIFYEKTEKAVSDTLADIMKAHQCAAVCYQTDTLWDSGVDVDPSDLLQEITHILFICAKDTAHLDSASTFFFGMSIGKNLPILILQQGCIPLPENCRQFAVMLTLDTFEDYFIKEQQDFLVAERKRLAHEALLNLSRSCIDSNFATAVQEGKYEIVRLFLEAGYNASQRDKDGTPLLSLAVRHSQYEMASLLLEYGAEINLCAEDRSYSALMEAAQIGDLKTAQLLLSKNADTNIQGKNGQTALIFAVGRKDVPMVKLLIEHHADWNIADRLGMSALGYAKLFNNKEILEAMQQP